MPRKGTKVAKPSTAAKPPAAHPQLATRDSEPAAGARIPSRTADAAGIPSLPRPSAAFPQLATPNSALVTQRRPSPLLDTRIIYCGDCLDQLRKLPAGCVDLIYIDPPFNSHRNYEVFWGALSEPERQRGAGTEPRAPASDSPARSEDRHASTAAYIDYMRPRADGSVSECRMQEGRTRSCRSTPKVSATQQKRRIHAAKAKHGRSVGTRRMATRASGRKTHDMPVDRTGLAVAVREPPLAPRDTLLSRGKLLLRSQRQQAQRRDRPSRRPPPTG